MWRAAASRAHRRDRRAIRGAGVLWLSAGESDGGAMTHSRALRGAGVSVLLVIVGWLAPGGALAAGKPIVTTGAAADIAQQTVTLTGSVNPNGAATTYFFQYGTTSLYGAQTTPTRATRNGKVTAPVAGLAPATTYHYRLVAQNSHGLTKGGDHSSKARRQPLGVVLAATSNPVGIGKPTILSGTLTGTGNAGRAVVLQANPFPYTQGFVNASNAQVTGPAGQFSFPLLSVPVNTQYR